LREVVLCLDNDDAGQQAAERISKALQGKGYSASVLFPAEKDWNETLQQSAQQEVPAPCLHMHT